MKRCEGETIGVQIRAWFVRVTGTDFQDSIGVRLTGTRPPDLCPLLLQFTRTFLENAIDRIACFIVKVAVK